jgi:hypothetical protein
MHQPRIEQRLPSPAHGADLSPTEGSEQQRGQHPKPPQSAQAAVVRFDQWHQQADHATAEQQRTEQVQVRASPAGTSGAQVALPAPARAW